MEIGGFYGGREFKSQNLKVKRARYGMPDTDREMLLN
jgi:hypothetical protein